MWTFLVSFQLFVCSLNLRRFFYIEWFKTSLTMHQNGGQNILNVIYKL